jgi:hypothetical protein
MKDFNDKYIGTTFALSFLGTGSQFALAKKAAGRCV